ncbi:hypothetical protein M408DRAFT_325934 [Serendipita vermifera MAFF 305830]|uniref:Methyltransferase domain-containing protein n=1 Tax=Serendipita vermifera MAFF 305830 TaxID=933852 RepID=A0A0C2X971_SERVB|nr:hypothetical protein M408DRAFT_325934 [Serendipita vermifera MAFF 305830]
MSDEDVISQTRAVEQAHALFSQYLATKALCSDEAAKDRLLLNHILAIQSAIYAVHPYPCIAMFRFLYPTITQHPIYKTTILPLLTAKPSSAAQTPPLFLDVGCCVGQVLRQLIVDGVDPTQLTGVDLYQDYLTHGYDLFMDGPDSEHPLKSRLEAGDIFDPIFIADLNGRVTVIHISSVFHLFSWDRQLAVAKRLDELLVNTDEGLIVGSQLGVQGGGELAESHVFRHDSKTFKHLWESVGDGKWDVEVAEHVWDVDLKKHPMKLAREGDVVIVLRFVVKRRV